MSSVISILKTESQLSMGEIIVNENSSGPNDVNSTKVIPYTVTVKNIFICPITRNIINDPVVCQDGYSYERDAIVDWLQTNDTSPVTRETVAHKQLYPNNALKRIIQRYKKDNPHLFPVETEIDKCLEEQIVKKPQPKNDTLSSLSPSNVQIIRAALSSFIEVVGGGSGNNTPLTASTVVVPSK